MTTITLKLTPELEQKLLESIARQDAFSIRQLRKKVDNNQLENEDELEADLDRFFNEIEQRNGSIPTLSDYALSRESIYDECGKQIQGKLTI